MLKYSVQRTIEPKIPLQIIFWKCSERKDCSKSLKIPKKSLQNCPFSPNVTGLQSAISAPAKTDSRKNVSFECPEIVGSLPGKGPQWNQLIKLAGLLLETKRL